MCDILINKVLEAHFFAERIVSAMRNLDRCNYKATFIYIYSCLHPLREISFYVQLSLSKQIELL